MIISKFKNHLFFNSLITKKSSDQLLLELYKMQSTKNKKIILHVNSNGGDVYSALNIVDNLESFRLLGTEIITVGEGLVASAATLLLVSGSKRLIRPNARFLMHQIRCLNGISGTYTNIKDELYNIDSLNNSMIEIYKKNSKMTYNMIQTNILNEKELTAIECINNGLVDWYYSDTK